MQCPRLTLSDPLLLSLHNPVARAARPGEQASRAAREGLYWFSKTLCLMMMDSKSREGARGVQLHTISNAHPVFVSLGISSPETQMFNLYDECKPLINYLTGNAGATRAHQR